MIMEEEIISALKEVITVFGEDQAKIVEQVFRNETRHFLSGNFQKTLSPGMEAFGVNLPYGWTSAGTYWLLHPKYAPTGVYDEVENNSGMSNSRGIRHFLKFDSLEASMMTVAFILHSRGGDGGSWFSVSDAAFRAKYNDYLSHIIPKFVNEIIK